MKLLFVISFLFFSSFLLAPQEVNDDASNTDSSFQLNQNTDDLSSDNSDSNEVDTDFNFGEVNDETTQFSVSVGGSIYVGITPFFSDMKNIKELKPSSLLWGSIHLDAQAPLTHAYINLTLNDQTLPFNLGNKWATTNTNKLPSWLDEAFLQVSMGSLYFSGGVKKVTWGRADVLSVLDVINPHNNTQLLSPDTVDKMGIPLLHFFAYTPHDIKMEVVFLPIFTPHLLAIEGRWCSIGMKQVAEFAHTKTKEELSHVFGSDTAKFKFAHTGTRLSTTFANSHDVGFQYFYGHTKMPIVVRYNSFAIAEYLPVHHIGLDYGTAIGPVNLKLETCANIIGKNRVKDSNIEWNANISSPLTHGFSLNLVIKETIWMYAIEKNDEKVSYALFRKNRQTETISFLSLSQTILRGAVEWKLSLMMGLEDVDFAILPSLHAMFGTIIFDAQLGVFLGKNYNGTFSQYHKNNYIKLSFGYEF